MACSGAPRDEAWRGGVAIGDQVLDLAALARAAPFEGLVEHALRLAAQDQLNAFMGLGPQAWGALRLALSRALRVDGSTPQKIAECLVPQAQVEYAMPARVGDYTDFLGTLSGPTLDQAAALIELTEGGKRPLQLTGGETRSWLEDGDRVCLRAWCERPGPAA